MSCLLLTVLARALAIRAQAAMEPNKKVVDELGASATEFWKAFQQIGRVEAPLEGLTIAPIATGKPKTDPSRGTTSRASRRAVCSR